MEDNEHVSGALCAKTALLSGRRAEKMLAELARAVEGFAFSCFRGQGGAERELAELSGLAGRRNRAQILLDRVESTLSSIPQSDARLLRRRFWKKQSAAQISDVLGITVRSVYRRLTGAEQRFFLAFEKKGFSDDFGQFLGDGWIRSVYLDLAKRAGRTDR